MRDYDSGHESLSVLAPAPSGTAGKRSRTEGLSAPIRRKADGAEVAPGAADAVSGAAASAGHPLPSGVRGKFEQSLGADLGGVRVHAGAASAEAARSLGAQAYAIGSDVHFGEGYYDPGSAAGERLLAHEVAHTVQQAGASAGPQAKLEVSEPGDHAEQQADRAAEMMIIGQPYNVTPATGVGRQIMRTTTADVAANIVGHASPRWEHSHGGQRSELNLNLSRDRAAEMERYFREVFGRHLADRATATIEVAASGVTSEAQHDAANPGTTATTARGDQDTLQEAGGNAAANDDTMRRVNLHVTITWHHAGSGGLEVPHNHIVTIPGACVGPTRDWGINLHTSMTAGGVFGGAMVMGTLRNRTTGQQVEGTFTGLGMGAGEAYPSGSSGETPFATDRPVMFSDFHNIATRYSSASIEIGPFGYSLAAITFPSVGVNSLDVSGRSRGLGISVGTYVGVFRLDAPPPPDVCAPDRVENHGTIEARQVPFAFDVPRSYDFVALFDTGSARMPDAGLEGLETFVTRIMRDYDSGGQGTPGGGNASR